MRPNVLFLMTDQMQGRVLDPNSPCMTPNIDRLMQRGVRFERAYTPNAVCSPARASLMTGLLPHNHGVLEVTHVVDDDQCVLRTEHPHWAQRLSSAGYRTGYFGKWHVERSNRLEDFGWDTHVELSNPGFRQRMRQARAGRDLVSDHLPSMKIEAPPGYPRGVLYAVTEVPASERSMGVVTDFALEFLQEVSQEPTPWCCFVSVTEPHDPFYAGKDAYERYDVDSLSLPDNVYDDLEGRPNLYRKAARVFHGMTDQQRREAMGCYYASITEIDEQFGRVLAYLEESGQLENTLVIFTSDHGELLGAHGLYMKNISAFEEVYNIPLVVAGPGVAQGVTTRARVGLHDVGPTILDMFGLEPFHNGADSTSFTSVLRSPKEYEEQFDTGYAEYHGGRYRLTQRVVWQGDWKLVHNGFDDDELYHLVEDPSELRNLVEDPRYEGQLRALTRLMWQRIEATGDHALLRSRYPVLRLAPFGPDVE